MKFALLLIVSTLLGANAWACRSGQCSYYEWTNYGECYEWTPNGAPINLVPIYRCQRASGYMYNWTNYGECYMWTPNGAPIKLVPNFRCRQGCGVVRYR
jgi:hypothetical protein